MGERGWNGGNRKNQRQHYWSMEAETDVRQKTVCGQTLKKSLERQKDILEEDVEK